MELVMLLLVIWVFCLAVGRFESKRVQHNIFCQFNCDDTYATIVLKDREELRLKEVERRRAEYLEWSSNCKQIFDNKHVAMDGKVCRRTIDVA